MDPVEVQEDWYASENPLRFKQEKVQELIEAHGIRPYWANRQWRGKHRGWGIQTPLKVDDSERSKAVLACLENPPKDPKYQLEDGLFVQGDVCLSTSPVEEYDKLQRRRWAKANKGMSDYESQDMVSKEVEKIRGSGSQAARESKYIEPLKGQQFDLTQGGVNAITSGGAPRGRGRHRRNK